jgi:hypothetical protein
MTIRFGFSLTGRGALADRATITTLAQRAEALGYDSDRYHARRQVSSERSPSLPRGRRPAGGARNAARVPKRPRGGFREWPAGSGSRGNRVGRRAPP